MLPKTAVRLPDVLPIFSLSASYMPLHRISSLKYMQHCLSVYPTCSAFTAIQECHRHFPRGYFIIHRMLRYPQDVLLSTGCFAMLRSALLSSAQPCSLPVAQTREKDHTQQLLVNNRRFPLIILRSNLSLDDIPDKIFLVSKNPRCNTAQIILLYQICSLSHRLFILKPDLT